MNFFYIVAAFGRLFVFFFCPFMLMFNNCLLTTTEYYVGSNFLGASYCFHSRGPDPQTSSGSLRSGLRMILL
jgi:hypothetical protein